MPMVSVVTAVYNAAGMIENCIASVSAQQYPRLEHIVVDGGSTDGTTEIVSRHHSRLGAWVSERDDGVYDAWNKAVRVARGEWIAFLGADDTYLPGSIGRYVETARTHPGAEYISSRIRLVYPGGQSRVVGRPWEWPRFRRYMCVAHVGSFHRRSLLERLGPFDPSYRIVGDYELLLRAGADLSAAFLDEVTARMAAGGQSDGLAAVREAHRAKVRRAATCRGVAATDYLVAAAKDRLRKCLLPLLCSHEKSA